MNKNIYSHESQDVIRRFSKLNTRDYIIIPIDYAGKEHTVQFCLGTGELLLNKPIRVFNNNEGVKFLKSKIDIQCRKHHIRRPNVIVAVEDPPDFIRNFMNDLKFSGLTCVRVNSRDASKLRNSKRASSDTIDLTGIAQCVIDKKFYEIKEDIELYFSIKRSSRNRQARIKERTALKNRIRRYSDILFPGFLNYNNTSLTPYSMGCLMLMEDEFSVFKIKRMCETTLSKNLKKWNVMMPKITAATLKSYTEKVLPPSESEINVLSNSLGYAVKMYRNLNDWISHEEKVMAEQLVQSVYFYLTTIPGVAVILAGGIAAEVGDSSKWKYPEKIASYGGIAAREKQSGGSEKKAVQFSLPNDCNRRLKNYLIQVGLNMGKFTHPAGKYIEHLGKHKLYKDFWKAENRGSKSGLSTARKFLNIAKKLILDKQIYYPQKFISGSVKPTLEESIAWYRSTIDMLKKKWATYDLSYVPDEKNNLKKTIKALEEIIEFYYNNRTDTDN